MLQFDALADYFQKMYLRRLKATCLLSLAFVCAFELFAHVHPLRNVYVLGMALAFLAAAFAVVWLPTDRSRYSYSKRVQLAYLSTRTIAEILRIQFFLAGLLSEQTVHQQIMRRHVPILNRVRLALDEVHVEIGEGESSLPAFEMDAETVREAWFCGQRDYFALKAPLQSDNARRWHRYCLVAFGLGILVMIALIVVTGLRRVDTPYGETLLILAPISLAVAASCGFYLEQRGFKSNAERFEHSPHMYALVGKSLTHGEAHQTATEALYEVVDWYVTSVEREISVHT